jgi:hypothetical protein
MNHHPYLHNKYTSWYYSIIQKAKVRITDCYTEQHHIIPDCFYIENRSKGKRPGWLDGNSNIDDNIVNLTFREHFICHWLLTKMITGRGHHMMEAALSSMKRSNSKSDRPLTSLEYARIKLADKISKTNRKLSEDTKLKISSANKGKKRSEEAKEKMRGRKLSDETKEKLRVKALSRPPMTDEHKSKISKANKGRKRSEESIIKMKETLKLIDPSTRSHPGEKNGMYGRKHSDAVRKAQSLRAKGNRATTGLMRIYNPVTDQGKSIPVNDPIPDGWIKGLRPRNKILN